MLSGVNEDIANWIEQLTETDLNIRNAGIEVGRAWINEKAAANKSSSFSTESRWWQFWRKD